MAKQEVTPRQALQVITGDVFWFKKDHGICHYKCRRNAVRPCPSTVFFDGTYIIECLNRYCNTKKVTTIDEDKLAKFAAELSDGNPTASYYWKQRLTDDPKLKSRARRKSPRPIYMEWLRTPKSPAIGQ